MGSCRSSKKATGESVSVVASVRDICDEVAWLDDGRLRRFGAAEDVVDAYVDQVRERRERADTASAAGGRGGRAVELGEALLLDEAGRPVQEVGFDSPITVEIPYRVNRPVSTPVFGIAVHRNLDSYHGQRSHRGIRMEKPFIHVIGLRPQLAEWGRRHGVGALLLGVEQLEDPLRRRHA